MAGKFRRDENQMTEVIIHVENLRFSYDEAEPAEWALSVPSFTIKASELCLLSGDNMSGKSTFLKLVGGLLPRELWDGTILVCGERAGAAQLSAASVILSADDHMFPELTVLQNIWIALPRATAPHPERVGQAALPVLTKSGIFDGEILHRPLGDLSSGGRALVKLARAYVSDRPIIIVDEISSFLDAKRATLFLDAVLELRGNGRAVLIVSHSQRDRDYLREHGPVQPYHINRKLDQSILERLDA